MTGRKRRALYFGAVTDREHVRNYWECRPCGTDGDPFPEGSPSYFRWITDSRYRHEPFIEKYARFTDSNSQDVLEVGIGVGTDAERFARAGARFCGIDLTERGVQLTGRRFELAGLSGRFEQADAEALPFPNSSFDFVYSWGVIHHSPDPPAAAREMVRVCRPGGRVCCMVYNRHSLFALQGKIFYGLLRGKPGRPIDEIAAKHFESPGTQLFNERQLRAMFSGLKEVRVTREVTPYDARIGRRVFVPAPIRRLIPRHLGYFMVLEGLKA